MVNKTQIVRQTSVTCNVFFEKDKQFVETTFETRCNEGPITAFLPVLNLFRRNSR